MEAIVLAGGLGTRLRSVVSDLPKPLAPVLGEPFLSHVLSYWRRQGIDRFILSVGYEWSKIEKKYGSNFEGAEVVYAVESSPLGTGGGLANAVSFRRQNATFLVLNGDTFFDTPLKALKQFHDDKSSVCTLALTQGAPLHRYNAVVLEGDRIVRFESREEGRSGGWINGGVYLMEPQVAQWLKQASMSATSLEDSLFPRLCREFAVFGFPCDGGFIDIGIPADYARADNFFNERAL